MRQSKLFTKILKESPRDEESLNAQLLLRGGFAYKNSAGVFTYLPLGWRVIRKIADLIRKEMDVIGGEELLMPALVDKKYLDATGRWDVEIGFEAVGKKEKKSSFVLGWTHEEVLTEIASKFINSYKDLPFAAYQIQTKFRNEPRAKSGLLRGREFLMKDLYSFHADEGDFLNYYATVAEAYHRIFESCGLKAYYTLAAGGDFTSSNTHEFQVLSEVGEDTIFVCEACNYAENSEISKLKNEGECPKCEKRIKESKSIEVGNIFPLGNKYSKSFNLRFLDAKGERKDVIMGSYGIGLGRVMGAVVEVSHDNAGIIWPEAIAPFKVHLVALLGKDDAGVKAMADKIYEELQKMGIEVFYDDRTDKSVGEKFADSDIIGIPLRLVVSSRNGDKFEVKSRQETEARLMRGDEVKNFLLKK